MSDVLEKKTYGIVNNPLNNKIIAELKAQNEDVMVFPALKTERKRLTGYEIELIKNIADFDWLVVTDVFAADYLIDALSEAKTDFFDLDNLTICVFGEAVADRLRFVQIHSDIIPARVDDEFVLKALLQYAGDDLKNAKIAVFRGEKENIILISELQKKLALVFDFPVYSHALEVGSSKTRLKTLLTGGAIDDFIISSPEELLSLKQLTGGNFSEILSTIRLTAASEVAFQTLQEHGFRPLYFHQP